MRTIGAVLALVMICTLADAMTVFASDTVDSYWWEQYLEYPEDDVRAPGVNEDGQVITHGGYILFTSDTHSATFLEKDLLEMANELVREDTGDQGLI